MAHYTARDVGAAQQQLDTLLHRADGSGYAGEPVGTFTVQVIDRDRRPPKAVQVRDGPDETADADFNDGSLTALSANWSFEDAHSEIDGYQYALGTSCGETDAVDWTADWSSETSVTLTGLSLRTGQTYYFSVRARDAEGNVSDADAASCSIIDSPIPGLHRPFSNGVAVRPVLTVSIDPPLIEAGRITVDAERTITITVFTNAHHGFQALMYRTESDLPDFTGGTYEDPAAWTEAVGDGLAFSVGDCDVNGGGFWSAPNCGGERLFAPVTRDSPGNVVADHTALVTGATGPVSESYRILLRAPTSGGRTGAGPTATLIIQVMPEY